jgi:hypothetical protein
MPTREILYDLIWSNFNMSDVALAKRRRASDGPMPYRGYGREKPQARDPHKLPLPKYRTRTPAPTLEPTAPAQPITPVVRSEGHAAFVLTELDPQVDALVLRPIPSHRVICGSVSSSHCGDLATAR